MDQTGLIEEIMVSLKQEKSRQDSLDALDQHYNIETQIEISEREWCFSSVVMHNGVEITDDPELLKERTCRKRVAQMNKTKALWNLFIKEAATMHLERCETIGQRLEKSGNRPLTINGKMAITLAVGALLCFLLSMYYLTRQTAQPTILRSDLDDRPPPVTPVALTLTEPEPVPPVDVPDHGSDDGGKTSTVATETRAPDEIESADHSETSTGLTDESSSNPVSVDAPPPAFPNAGA